MNQQISARSRWAVPAGFLLSLLFLVGYVLFGLTGWQPAEESLARIGQVSGWCERVHQGLLREPVNALSNLGFMVAGLAMLILLSRDRTTPTQFHGLNATALLYAYAVIWLGPGSMLMHGTHTRWGGWADNLSMVMYILIPWLVNVAAMARWQAKTLLLVYAGTVTLYAVARWEFGGRLGIGLDLFGLSIGLWCISEILYRFWSPLFRWLSGFVGFGVAALFGILPWDMLAEPARYWWVVLFWVPALFASHPPQGRRSYPWYFTGAVLYMAAFAIWLTGRDDHPWCRPDSVLQAHAAWHLLTAAATFCFFLFLRTERATQPQSVK